ncbi:unnamed protein product, partial [Iphiclides podalirius]
MNHLLSESLAIERLGCIKARSHLSGDTSRVAGPYRQTCPSDRMIESFAYEVGKTSGEMCPQSLHSPDLQLTPVSENYRGIRRPPDVALLSRA